MNYQIALALFFLLTIIVIYVWDAWAFGTGQPEKSVSTIIKEWARAQPILPFAVGLLVGHIFW